MDVTNEVSAASGSGRDPRDLRFSQLFEAAAIGIGLCHFDGSIVEANSALGRMLGYDRPELTGANLWKFHRPDFQRTPAPARHRNSDHLVSELIHGVRDSFTLERRFERRDGSEFWGQLTVSLVRNTTGEPAFLVALLEDATERKRIEGNLRQAEKMEVIGRLAGGIAHDFNNLLTGILLYCDLLLMELEPAHRLRPHVEGVRMAGEQGAALTQQLLVMSRKQASEPGAVQINEIVSSTETLLRRLIGEQIELTTVLDSSAGMVYVDPGQLRQVLLNLVLNARDAVNSRWGSEGGGKIRLSTQVREIPTGAPGNAQRSVSLIVEDNGCGMSAGTRAHLFELFFTTKRLGEGTGMGLATVQHIVSEAGGRIEVASEPGRGTRIEVFLPPFQFRSNLSDIHIPDSQLLERHNNGDPSC